MLMKFGKSTKMCKLHFPKDYIFILTPKACQNNTKFLKSYFYYIIIKNDRKTTCIYENFI